MPSRVMRPRNKEEWRAAYEKSGSNLARMYTASSDDIAELRRQQAASRDVVREESRRNSWMAIPAMAPFAVPIAAELGGLLAARAATSVAKPWMLPAREPYVRVGDNWATRAGRRAHAALKQRVQAKPGWSSEPTLAGSSGRTLKPDVQAPSRNPIDPSVRFQTELKPNTPTGRAAAARAVRKYLEETKNKTRPIFYDPKDFI